MARYDFASDTAAGAMPEALEALGRFNGGFMGGYGEDAVCARAGDLIRALLDADAEIWFAASGTAANAVSLAALARPFEAVAAHRHSHVIVDEAGAPGFFGAGLGLIPLPGPSGLMDPAALATLLAGAEEAQRQSPAALSLTHATEFGALYGEAALADLIGQARSAGLAVHLDGARLAHAVAAGFDPKTLARLGVDILVLGGSKVGAPPTEAIVILNKALARRFGPRLKHGGQLTAKSRFLAAPWIGMLETGAWVTRAAHANAMARRLAALTPFPVVHPVQTNGVFVAMDPATLARLAAAGWAAYRFVDETVRFMCSWSTTPEGVDEFGAVLREVADRG
jgi:threonine aldolase